VSIICVLFVVFKQPQLFQVFGVQASAFILHPSAFIIQHSDFALHAYFPHGCPGEKRDIPALTQSLPWVRRRLAVTLTSSRLIGAEGIGPIAGSTTRIRSNRRIDT